MILAIPNKKTMIRTSDMDEDDALLLRQSFSSLKGKNIEIITSPLIKSYIEKLFSRFSVFPSNYRVEFRDIIKLDSGNGVYYLIYVSIGLGYQYSPKYGQKYNESEYQVWGCARLCDNFDKVIVQPKTEIENAVAKFLMKLFRSTEDIFPEHALFNKKYDLSTSDKQKTREFFNDKVIKTIAGSKGLNLAINEDEIVIGFSKIISSTNTRTLTSIFDNIPFLQKESHAAEF